MRSNRYLLCCAALYALSAPSALPAARPAAEDRLFLFRIAGGTLDSALRAYARATGRQVLYRGEIVRGLRFAGMSGLLTADEALTRLLAGTGLTAQRPAPNVVVIQAADRPIADMTSDGHPSRIEEEPAAQDIVVTGTNIRGGSSTSPVSTITRRDIERSGKATVGEVVTAQSSNYNGTGNPVAALTGTDRTGLNESLATSVNLRGLGSEATLTLINGRRVAGSGGRGDFTDLSAIPTLGVERIEILTDGASAIYGSDAVAGVVNIIMRQNLNGVEARARGSASTRTGEHRIIASAALGSTWSGGSAGIVYEYAHDDALSSRDRRFTATGDLRPFGGTDRRSFLSSPATILAFDAGAGAYLPAFAVPTGGATSAAQLRPGTNLSYPLAGSDLSPKSEHHIVYGYANQRVGEVALHADVRYASRAFNALSSPQSTIFAITADNPYFISSDGAPFSVIGYSFENELPNSRMHGRVQALSATAALGWDPGRWSIDASATYARERNRTSTDGLLNATLLNEALGLIPDDPNTSFNTAQDGFFNPYGSGSSNSRAILDFIGQGYSRQVRTSSIMEGTLKADGSVVSLLGADLRAAVGGSVRHERFRRTGENFFSGASPLSAVAKRGDRTIEAAFLELNLPVVGGPQGGTKDVGVDLSFASRYEHYPDFGSTFNPKLGLAWRPAAALQLHASWGTSFRAPALTDLNDPFRVSVSQLPTAAGAFTPVLLLSGGNPDLRPETARTWNVGAVLTPSPIPSLRVEANVFRTRFSRRIGQPVLQNILTALSNPDVAGFVERISPATSAADLARVRALLATPGAFGTGVYSDTAYTAIIDARSVNTSTLTVSGLDGSIRVAPSLWGGRLDVGVSATWLFSYRQALTPLSPAIEKVDRLGFPASIKANASLGYTYKAVSGSLIARYAGGYTDDLSVPSRPIRDWLTVDATLGFAPERGPLRGWAVTLVAENLFDRDPPFVDQSLGYGFDGANANPFGRTVALQLNTRF